MARSILKPAITELVGNRRWLRTQLERLAGESAGARILEIGSGKPVNGEYPYSMAEMFGSAGEFVMSDLDPSYGHAVVDLTDVPFDREFDLVLCISVLEHIPDFPGAVAGLRRILRPGGRAFVAVPFAYPMHDEPHDYWRFTEHGLRHMFSDFEDVSVSHRGWRKLPTGLALSAVAP